MRQLLDNQQDSVDAQDIVTSIKTDLSINEIYAFTPKGDVISLPMGATVIDFAYAIHTEVGHRMVGAKVDGRMVSLDTVVENGKLVNIITSNAQGQGPSRDWLGIVKTASSRSKIRSWFKRERRDENIIRGKTDLEREFKRYNIILEPETLPEFLLRVAKSQHLNTIDDFYAAIGYGGILLSKIMVSVKDLYQRTYKTTAEAEIKKQLEKSATQRPKKAQGGVIVEGLDGCLVKFAGCCSPLPGDSIVGYITRGHGVSVHRADCVNVDSAQPDPNQRERWISCEWADRTVGETFNASIDIHGNDRKGLLMDISAVLLNMHLTVQTLNARKQDKDQAHIQIVVSTTSVEQLRHIMATLAKIGGVTSVVRGVGGV